MIEDALDAAHSRLHVINTAVPGKVRVYFSVPDPAAVVYAEAGLAGIPGVNIRSTATPI
jgi:hypothetical protein